MDQLAERVWAFPQGFAGQHTVEFQMTTDPLQTLTDEQSPCNPPP